MQEIHPSSFQEFLSIFNKLNNDGETFYRGQADANWKLLPGLGRNERLKTQKNSVKNEKKLMKSFKKMICKFSLRKLIQIQSNGYAKEWQWSMIGQHYGLPTRLLDFTGDKHYALQFAITEIEHFNKDGAFFVYIKDHTYKGPDEIAMKHSILLPPSSFMFQVPNNPGNTSEENKTFRRQLIQRSKFFYITTNKLFNCLSTDNEHSQNLTKIIIKKEYKLDLIGYLIQSQNIDYDPFAGRNKIDYIAAILKDIFMAKT